IAAGGNINPEGLSMFEPIGGSAPKYTGQGKINPLAAIGALAMLLREICQEAAADRVESAIAFVTSKKLKGMAAGKMGYTTGEVGDLVAEAVTQGLKG
ncbi:MAG TPA: isocitrate/isopropylmalate family dehydrogenase, partial [Phycisphaerae bacterium]|nr:isocitrate/isopropylmalate family dehydrogenase [Phycisphaerae bacterium]